MVKAAGSHPPNPAGSSWGTGEAATPVGIKRVSAPSDLAQVMWRSQTSPRQQEPGLSLEDPLCGGGYHETHMGVGGLPVRGPVTLT